MTQLLVSVRNAEEAEIALAGGADLIDIKEPRRGALGAADPEVWRGILQVVGDQAPTSAALGELAGDFSPAIARQADGFAYAKVGLSKGASQLRSAWTAARQAVPPAVKLVPAVYADLIEPGDIPSGTAWKAAVAFAGEVAAPLLVLDTFHKRGQTLLDQASVAEIETLLLLAEQQGIGVVLAGSLHMEAIAQLLPLGPAYIGVRGAACVGGRDGAIDLARVTSLAKLMSRPSWP